MQLTIAICTWNRAEMLRRTLEHMTLLDIPARVTLEILVVNNNCTDETDEIVDSLRGRLPVRRAFESEPYLSAARNHAVQLATGEYIIWTDDDVLVDSEWVKAYYDAFLRWPDAAIFGGSIEPLFEAAPPAWLLRTIDWFAPVLPVVDAGTEPTPVTHAQKPYGANMAFRADALAEFPFDLALGVSSLRGITSVGGEEHVVIRAMLDAGFDGWWVPDARVKHYVPPERMTIAHFRRKAASWGKFVSQRRLALQEEHVALHRLLRQALQAEVSYRLHRLYAEPEVWVQDLSTSGQYWGEVLGALSFRRHDKVGRAFRDQSGAGGN
jgi:glycosyltransferase involved in cell wall biosynthesis